ncbi:MAG: retinol dehydrogenase [Polyangiaceae bacterium]|nr:retinol dehydrogenase [Polyangiaceae bacterium]
MERVAVILNPNARRNRRRGTRGDELREIVRGWGQVRETQTLEELGPALRELLDGGAEYVVADGGDGCLHWVVNETRAVVGAGALPTFVPTNGGTIDFVARKSRVSGTVETILTRLVRHLQERRPPPAFPLDTLEVTGVARAADGALQPFRRLGFALAAGGVGQRFFEKYYSEPILGAPAIVRIVARATASHLATRLPVRPPAEWTRFGEEIFKPTRARVVIDGRAVDCEAHGAIHAGAFDVQLGGLFHVFPLAREEGRLHFQAGALEPLEVIRALPALVRGGAIPGERFLEVSGAEMIVEAVDEPLAPVMDGETLRAVVRLEVRRGPRIRIPRIEA